MSEKNKNQAVPESQTEENTKPSGEEEYSLNDDRRVKTLSPGQLVTKRFLRNRLAVTGLTVLVIMFLFSFLGGVISPYEEDELFYRYEGQNKEYCGVVKNEEYRFQGAPDAGFDSVIQAQTVLAMQKKTETFTYRDIEYTLNTEGEEFYSVERDGEIIGIAHKNIISPSVEGTTLSFDFQYNSVKALSAGGGSFTADGQSYEMDADGNVTAGGAEYAYISEYVVQAVMPDVFLTREFKEDLIATIESGASEFEVAGEEEGSTVTYTIAYDAANNNWAVNQEVQTLKFDTYSYPSWEHPLGTDRNGMDMLTRLMYGGRVSLLIGFIVVIIETVIGVILGGIAGYFGKWVDNLIMRIVDVFYCIPSMPIIIILGAMMDQMRVDPTLRMVYLMLILGFLGWAGIARLVRGQILSLREQEFMTATEACGVRVSRRIFRHLIPNVIPQLIVFCTMGLGSTIITEATLSFLGLGVKFPFASWGNIINDVNDTYVLTTYWFIWIPAGVLLLLTVLAFNLVGDGLRDAFDPKMKR